jgi:hypothetical protein
MGRLNEFIARSANAEDKVKSRFWESRFKCQALIEKNTWTPSVRKRKVDGCHGKPRKIPWLLGWGRKLRT